MIKKRFKTYLSIPIFLGLLAVSGRVSADEQDSATDTPLVTAELVGDSLLTADVIAESTVAVELVAEPDEAVIEEALAAEPAIAPEAAASVPQAAPEVLYSSRAAAEPVSYEVSTDAVVASYNQALPAHTRVIYSLWSDQQGDDDIYWYPADSQGKATITFANHQDYGNYTIQAYTLTAGRPEQVSSQTIVRERQTQAPTTPFSYTEPDGAKIELTDYRVDKTDFTVKVNGRAASSALTGVRVAVWSKDQGQDDIRWYEPTVTDQTATARIRVVDHSNTSDYYQVHVYTTYADGRTIGTNLGEHQIIKPVATDLARIEIFDHHQNKNDFGVRVISDERTKDIESIRVAVWSHEGGQDDLRWYEPALSYNQASLTINSSNHSRKTDTYTVHVYTTYKDGTMVSTNLGDVTIVKAPEVALEKAEILDYDPNQSRFRVHVTGGDVRVIREVRVAVWSEGGGQDDLKWYTPTISNNHAYQTVDVTNHSNTTDKYNVHVYTTYSDGTTEGKNLGQFQINRPAPSSPADISVVSYRPDKKDFYVRVAGTGHPITGVKIAVWSQTNGQDDLKWYTPAVVNNQVMQHIDISHHANTSDKYTVHVYTTYENSQTIGTNLGDYQITIPAPVKPRPTTSASQGRYDVINRIIYLDAGHGGSDPGAVYGVNEKELNLSIQRQLKARLEQAGYQVVLTRTGDSYMDLLERSRRANQSLADMFISIHFNASTNSAARGIETYHYQYYPGYAPQINGYHDNADRHERSSFLANAIHSATVQQAQAINNGVHRKTFAVLRETVAPSVLLELGYMSNPEENAKIRQASYQAKLVEGIFKGIQAYYRRFS